MPEISNRKLFYNTIFCQIFSPNGKFLIAGSLYGDVSVFDLLKSFEPNQIDNYDYQAPIYKFTAYVNQCVQSMVTTDDFLITGTSGEITGWDWKIVKSNKASRKNISWTIQIPTDKDTSEKPDVNSMVYSKEKHLLYAGCGDNKIYVINLDNGKILRCMESHENYIHCLAQLRDQLASASEDGTVKFWDLRNLEHTSTLTPSLNGQISRPKLGKWIGAVDFTEDWLLCGGGPSLSLWHLRTMETATIFDLPDEGIHVASIHDERIIAGGCMPAVYHLNYQGEVLAKVPTSSKTVYSIVHCEKPQKILSISGSSNNIDICTNFNYREFILKFA
ncbi:hypothetical protein HCN44_007056 [Aphidius gifuensis]|uniref:THO complex subunit 6 n=1 Tax=Aphidius gifuensis TaxID=684658 RepID=A0A834XMK8_APHGI|nr:THO complex subunit 6-like [Aphidius gifuensis]KAF7988746.1 hypothetical protein HCN44_007056 [Aphidius gifuensis]